MAEASRKGTREVGLIASLAPWLMLLARRRRRLLAGAALMALTVLSALGLLAVSGWFITASAVTGLALAAGVAATLDVYVPGGAIRLFAVTRTVSRYVERLYNHDTILRLLADLRVRMFATLARLDDHALSQRRASEWLNRLTADIDVLDALFLRLLAPPVVALLAIIATSVLLGVWLPSAGWLVLVVTGVALGWFTVGQARLGMAASRRQVAQLDALRGGVIEQLQGLAELEAYGTLAGHRATLERLESRIQCDQRRLGRQAALGNALVGAVIGVLLAGVLWLGARAHAADLLSGPLMVMMPVAVLALNEALAVLPAAFTRVGASRAAAERLNDLEDQSPRQGARSEALRQPPPGALAVSLERVSLCYPGSLEPVLRQVSFRLAAGRRLAVCGASGAGKSSVAALLAGRLSPTDGRVQVGGVAPRDLEPEVLAERVALLTQRVDLFDASLADNLRLADPQASDAQLWRSLEAVALADWADALPAGLATRVGEGGRQLSGGQARRLALARLMLRDPDLVLLDEPFAGLDADTAQRVASSLDRWLEGRTVLFFVHALRDGPFDPPGVTDMVTLDDGELCNRSDYFRMG
ncbi:thiol reductant ABC exporter subunit CydC [Halomonas urumqiensis]|uniref:Thiol reductant ABC exporter subunit CydC n=1 Tax=Halomonas urumqiensis TaxID=1684789 RepID=A0A2N7UPU3_9GAMM|nr:thiol reductant ABC exporter subunit CydC [Halomonas urumqiensis]PMR82458.1 thiol reductant ABC exporter subunit CydC [Halomonas urumqiensis]PTB04061.1 thiol reductant ABC exporter subunit CydC [Halomonas urumqiensis]GHE19678.1 thiol reductant ABC exporter subunit CydC [Halomonas urumqiensis]